MYTCRDHTPPKHRTSIQKETCVLAEPISLLEITTNLPVYHYVMVSCLPKFQMFSALPTTVQHQYMNKKYLEICCGHL
jgi:hypothetical protein